jgi:L-amino acid N-acyltransferase YncA
MSMRSATTADAACVADIYNHYIKHTTVTFEEQAVAANDMAQRIKEVLDAKLPWLIYEEERRVIGFAYASKWKGRCGYRYSVESTVYLGNDAVGKGYGGTLYRQLLHDIKLIGMHTVMAGIALPNDASVALHERLGFAKCGLFSQVGFKFDTWIDVGYWQLNVDKI